MRIGRCGYRIARCTMPLSGMSTSYGKLRGAWPLARLPEAAPEVWEAVESAYRMLGEVTRALAEGRVTEGSVVRCLVLVHIGRRTGLGVSPTRLARVLDMSKTRLAYHLDRLEDTGLVWRESRDYPDSRKVAVRLTRAGAEAVAEAARVLDGMKAAQPPVAPSIAETAADAVQSIADSS